MCGMSTASRYRRTDLWLREHWVISALVGAVAIAIGVAVGTAAYGGVHPFVGILAAFVTALAIGLPVRRGQARRLR